MEDDYAGTGFDDEGFGDEYGDMMADENVGDENEITEAESWQVISAYFRQKGLVRQQLESFDEFIENTMQEVVQESRDIELYPEPELTPDNPDFQRHRLTVHFGQVYLSSPTMYEPNGESYKMHPQMARHRHLTYASPLYVDVTTKETIIDEDGNDIEEVRSELERHHIGKVPIMLKSRFCALAQTRAQDLEKLGECPYDQGGYFIIRGNEKVIVAQERMSSNHVYCFQNKGNYVTEIRSMREGLCREHLLTDFA